MKNMSVGENFSEDISEDNSKEEWINGVRYMSPAPSPNHGRIYRLLLSKINNYLENKLCELFPDNDLILADIEGVIPITELDKPKIPDLFVVCDEKYKEVGNNIICVPDLVVEIVSPSSIKMDYEIKKEIYVSAGVKEYWIVDYMQKMVIICFNGEEKQYKFEDMIKVNIFEGLEIDLSKVKLT